MKTLNNFFNRTTIVVGLSFLLAGFLPTYGQEYETKLIIHNDIKDTVLIDLRIITDWHERERTFTIDGVTFIRCLIQDAGNKLLFSNCEFYACDIQTETTAFFNCNIWKDDRQGKNSR